MRVIVCPVNGMPHEDSLPNELAALQKMVGGFIEVDRFSEDVAFVVNEEGRLMGLPDNHSAPLPGFCGCLVIVGVDG